MSREEKKEGKGERRQKFSNFQLTWNKCNSDGEIEEEEESTQMTFMAIGDENVSSNNSTLENDDEYDENLESFVEKLHESSKDSYAKNKELNIKINALLCENSKLFQKIKIWRRRTLIWKKPRLM